MSVVDSGAPAAGVAVGVSGLRKSFGARPVLDGIDLEVRAGEFLAVVGRSGCGKTTLLRIIAGLERATAGEVLLDGVIARGLRREVRMVFQEARLLPWRTVGRNVAVGLPPGHRNLPGTIAAVLAQVGLAARARDWPGVLSGGQKQRVALARALVSGPGLLLLDEPLGALDALTRLEMQELVERIWRSVGFTAVLVTHDVPEAVALADRVVVLDQGRVALSLPVLLPRPRAREGLPFTGLVSKVLAHLDGPERIRLDRACDSPLSMESRPGRGEAGFKRPAPSRQVAVSGPAGVRRAGWDRGGA